MQCGHCKKRAEYGVEAEDCNCRCHDSETDEAVFNRWVSPNELFEAAKQYMLDGRKPESRRDWDYVVNFWAYNCDAEIAEAAVLLICKLFDVPMSDEDVRKIVQYQVARRRAS